MRNRLSSTETPSSTKKMKSAYVRTAILITIAATAVLAISLSRLCQVYRHQRSFEALRDSTAPNVLLIAVDSLRPDHLGCYGYPKGGFPPHMDRIAREGTLFTLAFNQASWTSPSLVSLFTALYPSVHGVDARGKSVSPSLPTLPKTLKRAGFSVPGLTYIVDDPNYHRLDFEQVPHHQTDLATWIEENGSRPFFIFVHIHTAHLPYNPKPPLDTVFLPPTIAPGFLIENNAIRFVRSNVLVRPEDIQFKGKEKHVTLRIATSWVAGTVTKRVSYTMTQAIAAMTLSNGEKAKRVTHLEAYAVQEEIPTGCAVTLVGVSS